MTRSFNDCEISAEKLFAGDCGLVYADEETWLNNLNASVIHDHDARVFALLLFKFYNDINL